MLTINDKRVLSVVEFAPDLTAQEIARKVKMKPSTVAAVIRRLEANGIIWRRAFVDPMRLGFQDIGLFFSISGASPAVRRRIMNRFVSSPNVGWFGLLAGQFQYGAIYLCRHIAELGDFLHAMALDSGGFVHDRVVSPRIKYIRFPRRYLHGSTAPSEQLAFSYEKPHAVIDALDLRILQALDVRRSVSLRHIAAELRVPLTTLDRRIRRMRADRIIRGFVYEIDVEKLQVSMSRLLVQTQGPVEKSHDAIRQFCESCPHISYLVEAMGTWDVEIGFESLRPDDDVKILHSFYDSCGSCVASSHVMREMKDLKFSYAPWSVSAA